MKLHKLIITFFLTLTLVNSCVSESSKEQEKFKKEVNIEVEKQSVVNADFKIFELDGRLVKMENYIGKPYIIAFWNTNDKNSIANLKKTAETKDKYGDKINILALSEEHVSKIIQFKNKTKFPFIFYKTALTSKEKKKTYNLLYDAQGNFVAEIAPNSYPKIENQLNE